jgi:hypothetical protein
VAVGVGVVLVVTAVIDVVVDTAVLLQLAVNKIIENDIIPVNNLFHLMQGSFFVLFVITKDNYTRAR